MLEQGGFICVQVANCRAKVRERLLGSYPKKELAPSHASERFIRASLKIPYICLCEISKSTEPLNDSNYLLSVTNYCALCRYEST